MNRYVIIAAACLLLLPITALSQTRNAPKHSPEETNHDSVDRRASCGNPHGGCDESRRSGEDSHARSFTCLAESPKESSRLMKRRRRTKPRPRLSSRTSRTKQP